MARKKRVSVFVSYSHRDSALKDDIVGALNAWSVTRRGTVWCDGGIVPGQEWEPQILRALKEASVILLLVSVDFLNSAFIRRQELAEAMRRHNLGTAMIIPVLLRTVPFFDRYPFGKLQALPSNKRPVEKWRRRADACGDIIQGVDRAVEDLLKSAHTRVRS